MSAALLTAVEQTAELLARLDAIGEEKRVSPNALKQVVRSVLGVLRGALRKNVTPKQLFEDFAQLGTRADPQCKRRICAY